MFVQLVSIDEKEKKIYCIYSGHRTGNTDPSTLTRGKRKPPLLALQWDSPGLG